MDKKTYEYMTQRASQYKRLKGESNTLKEADRVIKEFGAYKICDFRWGQQTELKNIGPKIKEYVLKAIEERQAEIEKEMEDI